LTTRLTQPPPRTGSHGPPAPNPPIRRRIMVSYDSSAPGRAALTHALALAEKTAAALTVVTVATKVPINGCASCRHSAVIWNREMQAIAREELAEAAGLVGRRADVYYTLAVGDPVRAISGAADRWGADTVVVASEPRGRLRRLFSAPMDDALRKLGRWEVVTGPVDQ
jgi:nucleotide-binding universal stress UspA family protein